MNSKSWENPNVLKIKILFKRSFQRWFSWKDDLQKKVNSDTCLKYSEAGFMIFQIKTIEVKVF